MLELKGVSFSLKDESGNQKGILKNINLTLEDEKIYVITGPNGGGKSTLAKIIMGIEKPTEGQILFNGKDITSLSISDRAKLGIGYAFQQPARFKGLTVRKLLNIAHGKADGRDLSEYACCELLGRVGLCSKEYLDRGIDNSLSGGELKRIEIATVMARKLKLAVYDEPEAGIDLWSFSMLVSSFRDISRSHKETVILISHQEKIIDLADEIIVVSNGEIIEKGEKEKVFPKLLDESSEICRFRKVDAE